ncbi:hypothetical protein [Streptomyces sp. NPDC004330]|uniref:hypothetical protein n=1 Tax=Streptomyces sp. NPDC004330 TaxID=3364700 RepID=UPI0036C3498F
MAKMFERSYGKGTLKRNLVIFAASSALLYILAAALGVKGGWDAAFPVLAVAVIVDALVLIAWVAFRSKAPTR